MKHLSLTTLAFMAVAMMSGTISASAQYAYMTDADTLILPERAIIVTGDPRTGNSREHVALLYSRENLAFDDPTAPRFLLLDRQGSVALGIGGYLKGLAMYDFDGSIGRNSFDTYDIPVPRNPASASRFGADVSHSTLFLKLVARTRHFGRMTVYIQTDFTAASGNSIKLKQAYLSVDHLTMGLARSTFADAPAMAPTVDPQGPSGQVTARNVMVQYIAGNPHKLSAAISAELPQTDFTLASRSEAIAQRVPDIPAYVQWQWGHGSHVRASGIFRQMSYRDLTTATNRMATGWGAQFSTRSQIVGPMWLFGHCTYGKGIARYVNDLDGEGFDLIPSRTQTGRMQAPGMMAFTAGLEFDLTSRIMVSGSYSQARLYDTEGLPGSTYRYGQYAVGNIFYTMGDLRVGLEYDWGARTNCDHQRGRANRLIAMMQYSF